MTVMLPFKGAEKVTRHGAVREKTRKKEKGWADIKGKLKLRREPVVFDLTKLYESCQRHKTSKLDSIERRFVFFYS